MPQQNQPGPSEPYEQDQRWTTVDTYTNTHLHPSSSSSTNPTPDILSSVLAHSAASSLPDIAVSPSQGKFLQLQAQFVGARQILEVGTLGGYSTLWMASSSPDVKVTSIEIDARHAEIARENLRAAGVGDRVDVRVGAGVDVLKEIVEEVENGEREKFDLVFIDADKENNWNYVDVATGICRKGACVIVDNVVRKGKLVVEDSGDPRIEGARRVVEMIGKDERLDGVVVQTVGEKNYDGFLIARVV